MTDETRPNQVGSLLPSVDAGADASSSTAEPDAGGESTASDHPEILVGAAFLGGLVVAQILKRLGSD